jgi:hypothetical protein
MLRSTVLGWVPRNVFEIGDPEVTHWGRRDARNQEKGTKMRNEKMCMPKHCGTHTEPLLCGNVSRALQNLQQA